MKESQGKMNLKTKQKPGNRKKVEANFLVESLGAESSSGEPKQTNWQKQIQLNHMKESQGKMNLKT